MLEWLASHAATIIISAVLILLLVLAVRYIIKSAGAANVSAVTPAPVRKGVLCLPWMHLAGRA